MTNYTVIFCVLLLCYGVIGFHASHVDEHIHTKNSEFPPQFQPYRTGYHFQPVKNWINDPNGPMLYKGVYHLFYQYNPHGTLWGPPIWAHSTSTDLVNWTPQPTAIGPQTLANINGSWSGSATILPNNKPVILFTGIDPQYNQVQNLAIPKDLSDPYLKDWTIVPQNPLIVATPENKINGSAFRDPTTAWIRPDGHWRILVGSRHYNRGLVFLFRSRDFVRWVKAKHPLYSVKGTGMWECPDLYPVITGGVPTGADTSVIGTNIKHVLKISLDDTKHDVYTIGTYGIMKDIYVPDSGLELNASSFRYDYGKYYASKTFYDYGKKRRVLLGWANESSTPEADRIKGWSGIHTIPRTIWLDKCGKQLIQWPILEIESLRENPSILPSQVIKGGSMLDVPNVTASQADVEILFKVKDLKNVEELDPKMRANPQLICSQMGASIKGKIGPFGLLTLASKGLEEYTAVLFRVFKLDYEFVALMCSDQSRSSLDRANDLTSYGTFVDVDPIYEGLSLRVLIDHSVIESFGGGGKGVITSRVYPKLAIFDKAHLHIFNNGTTDIEIKYLTAWSMKTAQIA